MILIPVEVKRSKIAGLGIFAKRDIRKGERVIGLGTKERCYTKAQYSKFSKRYKKILKHFAYWWNGEVIYPLDEVRFINHSCDANVKNFGKFDKAARDIRKGEELTYDYSILVAPDERIRCRCGSKNCRKIIKARKAH